MFLARMMSQDLSGTFRIDRDVSLTDLAIEFILIPLRVYWSRYKCARPLHAFEIGLFHDLASSSDLPSPSLTPTWWGGESTLGIPAELLSVLDSFLLEGSESLCTRTIGIKRSVRGLKDRSATAGLWQTRRWCSDDFMVGVFKGII